MNKKCVNCHIIVNVDRCPRCYSRSFDYVEMCPKKKRSIELAQMADDVHREK